MTNRIPGPRKPKPNFGQEMKAMAQIAGRIILPEIKLPKKRKPRGKDKGPRRQDEAIFRRQLIKYLRSRSCKVWRIENGLPGYRGLPDLFVVSLKTHWAGWIELKSLKGKLRPEQKTFQELCRLCGINHIVARTIDDVACVVDRLTKNIIERGGG